MKHSYIIINKDTGQAVCEIFTESLAGKVNLDKYIVKTALEYLCGLNSKAGGQ